MRKTISVVLLVALMLSIIYIPQTANAETTSALNIWVPTNIEKVQRDQSFPEVKNTSIKMSSAKNEYEGAQVIIKADSAGLNGVQVSISGLTHTNGTDSIGLENIKIYKQNYMNLTTTSQIALPVGWYPDALIPLSAGQTFDIAPSQNQGIWISVKVPKAQTEGIYTGSISITAGESSIVVPVELNVWNFELPDERNTKSAFAIWPDMIAQYYGLQKGSQEYWDMLEKYYWFQNEYRIAPDDLPIPEDNVDEYVRRAAEFINNPEVPCYRIPVYSIKDASGKTIGPDWVKTEELVTKLKSAGLLEKGYFYLGGWIDEPTPAMYPKVQEYCTKLKEIAPDVRNIVTKNPVSDLYGYVDTWCPILRSYDPVKADERKAAGDHIWWYTCVSPSHPYPSYHIEDELLSSRLFSWMQKERNIEGNLYWSTDIFQKYDGTKYVSRDVFSDPLAFPGANGDGFLMYPGKVSDVGFDGPVGSLRLEAIRDGLEDYEYLVLLENKINEKITALGINDQVKASQVMQYYYDELYTKINQFENNPEKMIKIREIIAQEITDTSLPNAISVVTPISDTQKEVSIYTVTGSAITVNGENVEAVNFSTNVDKFTKIIDLSVGENTVDIAINKNGSVSNIQRVFWVKQSEVVTNPDDAYELTLSDFESADQIANIVNGDTVTSLSTEDTTNGTRSLKVEFGMNNDWPNFQILMKDMLMKSGDWSKYDNLKFDIYNPSESERSLFIKFHDSLGGSDDSSTVNIEANSRITASINLAEIAHHGKVDLAKISRLLIGSWASEPYTLYFDNIRLTASEPPVYTTPLSDFESADRIANIVNADTVTSLSTEDTTNGTSSLKVEFGINYDWPNFQILMKDMLMKSGDWSKYDNLKFDIYNPSESERSLFIKFHDSLGGSDDSSTVKIEANSRITASINLAEIAHHGKVNLAKISLLEIGSWASEPYTLYFDNLRLVSSSPIVPPEEEQESYSVSANKVSTPVNIDGDLSDVGWMVNTDLSQGLMGEVGGNQAKFGLLWDENYLYIGADVKDSILRNEGEYLFNRDAIEIYIDPDNNKGSYYDEKDTQIIINYDSSEIMLGGSVCRSINLDNIIKKSKITAEGYTMEVAIPWTELEVVPVQGMKMGFDMLNDDNDEGLDCQNVWAWAGNSNNWCNPSKFGEVVLNGIVPAPAGVVVSVPQFEDINGVAVDKLNPGSFINASVNVKNGNTEATPVTLIVALYNSDNTLKNISCISRNIDPNEELTFKAGFILPDNTTGYYVKTFAWDSLENGIPLSNAHVFPAVK